MSIREYAVDMTAQLILCKAFRDPFKGLYPRKEEPNLILFGITLNDLYFKPFLKNESNKRVL
jgi:hypothetical protein